MSISSSSSERSASENDVVCGALENEDAGFGAGVADSAGLNAALLGPDGAGFEDAADWIGLNGFVSAGCADLNGFVSAGCADLKGLGSDDVAGLKGLDCADINA